MTPEPLLQRLTDLIVAACDPQQVLLFGSYAKGRPEAGSDLDLFVIGDFSGSRHLRDRELRELLHGAPLPVDLHLATPAEVAAEASDPRGFVSSVLRHARVLYLRETGSPSRA